MANNQGGVDGKWGEDAENNSYKYQYKRTQMLSGD